MSKPETTKTTTCQHKNIELSSVGNNLHYGSGMFVPPPYMCSECRLSFSSESFLLLLNDKLNILIEKER